MPWPKWVPPVKALSEEVYQKALGRLFSGSPQREASREEMTKVMDLIRQDPEVRRAWVTGSMTQSKPNPGDLDLLLEMSPTAQRSGVENRINAVPTLKVASEHLPEHAMARKRFDFGPLADRQYAEVTLPGKEKYDVTTTWPDEMFEGMAQNPLANRIYRYVGMPHKTSDVARLKQETAQTARGYDKGNLIRIKALAPLLALEGDE